MTTGQRIKNARKKAGLTQAELASKLGIPYQSIGQWERDLRNPKTETIRRIAAALETDFYTLAGFDKATQPEEPARPWRPSLHQKLESVGCSLGVYEEDAYIWINYPDGTLEVTEDELNELDQSTDSFIRFKLLELRERHPNDFRPKRRRSQAPQSGPEPAQTATESTATTPAEKPSERPQEADDGVGKQ